MLVEAENTSSLKNVNHIISMYMFESSNPQGMLNSRSAGRIIMQNSGRKK